MERHSGQIRTEIAADDPSLHDALDPAFDPRDVHVYVVVLNGSDPPISDVAYSSSDNFQSKSDGSNELESAQSENEIYSQ